MRRAFVVLLVALVMPAALPAAPAAAKTTTSVSDKVITVHLEIDCVGCEGKTVMVPDPENPTQTKTIGLAEKWELDALAAWGNAFENYKYCGRYRLKLDLTITPRGPRFKGGRNHRIKVDAPDGRGGATAGWDSGREANPSGPDGQRSPDGTRFYERSVVGTIPEDATSTVVAHEVGHSLGLGDDRDENNKVLPGRDGTLMVGGGDDYAGKNSPESHLRIDQSLINRIGTIADKVDPDVKCEQALWNGPIRTTYTASFEEVTCTAEENGTVTLAVVDDEVSGTIEASGSETCTGPVSSITEPTAIVIRLTGTLEDREFRLRYTEVIGDHALTPSCFTDPRFEIPVERGTGSAEITSNLAPGYTTTCNITVERQNDDEPVG